MSIFIDRLQSYYCIISYNNIRVLTPPFLSTCISLSGEVQTHKQKYEYLQGNNAIIIFPLYCPAMSFLATVQSQSSPGEPISEREPGSTGA